jgi:hypothetical protein
MADYTPEQIASAARLVPDEIGGDGGLTQLEHACIALKVPRSGNEQLDALIMASRRMDLAGQIAAGRAARVLIDTSDCNLIGEFADALLREAGWAQ